MDHTVIVGLAIGVTPTIVCCDNLFISFKK